MTAEQFHWTSQSGVEIVLPRMDKIKAGLIRKYRKSEPADFIFSILEDVSTDEMLARADDLDTGEINDLFEKWQESGASVGE
jgi:hypothetical protein